MIRVLLADDHALVRAGVRRLLDESGDVEVVGEAGTADELWRQAIERDADVAVADLSMPGRPMLEVLSELRSVRPGLGVLVLSMHAEDQYAIRTMRAGASGYINKASPPEELLRAVRTVAAGRRYVSAAVAELLAIRVGEPGGKPHEALSNREFEILRMLAVGRTVGEIAEQLGLSVKTISTFRSRVLAKLHVSTNADLTRYALENGLID